MSFNVYKFYAMNIGHNNIQSNNNMDNQQLPTTDQQRESSSPKRNQSSSPTGIIITKDHKWQKQTENSCRTANRVLGSFPAISGTKTENWSYHCTNPSSAPISNMQCNSVPRSHLRRDIDKIRKDTQKNNTDDSWNLKTQLPPANPGP